MSDESDECEQKLKELCDIMIHIFDELKAKGMISEAEYNKHTELKRRFLNSTD